MLPQNMFLRPITQLSQEARANLRGTLQDEWGRDAAADVDKPATAEVALDDIQRIVKGISYLPPLAHSCEEALAFARELHLVGPYQTVEDAANEGHVASPSQSHIRWLMQEPATGDTPSRRACRRIFSLLTEVTRLPEGSAAPGGSDGPPARVTVRCLSETSASTMGEPKHVDVKSKNPMPPATSDAVIRRPRLIWTMDARNPLRIISWRARACIDTEPPEDGGGIVLPEALRCDPPFLHEGLTTTADGKASIGPRLQLVTDPDWFNVNAARELMEAARVQTARRASVCASTRRAPPWPAVCGSCCFKGVS